MALGCIEHVSRTHSAEPTDPTRTMSSSSLRTRTTAIPPAVLAGVCVLLIAATVVPARAEAGQYTTRYCNGSTNSAGWVVYSGAQAPNSGTRCALKVDFGVANPSNPPTWGTGTVGTFTWTAPDNTSIASWTPNLTFSVGRPGTDPATTGAWHLTYGPGGAGDRACAQGARCQDTVTPFAGATRVSSRLTCDPLPGDARGNCRQGAVMVDDGGTITVADGSAPTAGAAVSGTAVSSRPGVPARGTLPAAFSARDLGGGIKAVSLVVDGTTVDRVSGACESLPSFRKVPCPLALDGRLSVNTTRITDGRHRISVVASDVAGNASTLYSGAVYVANKPVGPGSPAELRGSPTTSGAIDDATVSASFPATARHAPRACRSKRYRRHHKNRCRSRRAKSRFSGRWSKHGVVLTGRVASRSTKQGIAGAPVAITGTSKRVGGRTTYRATTNSSGRYRFAIPRTDGSRALTVGYRARRFDEVPAASANASTVIKARATLAVNRRSVRRGRSVRFAGHILDRTAGVPILLQVHQRGKWRTFRTSSTRSRGTYRVSYGLRGIAPGRYRFRAQVRPTSRTTYAFAHGYSPSVQIRIR